jgi:peptide/nickel transport system permease protein
VTSVDPDLKLGAAGPAGLSPLTDIAPLEQGAAEVTAAPVRIRRHELLYFALRNRKLVLGLGLVLAFLAFALIGPLLTDQTPLGFGGPTSQRPSSAHWFGTTASGQDVFAQFVYGLRASFVVGALGGGLAAALGMLVGFTAGYRGGFVDEVLNMITNVVLVIPTLALLIIIAGMASRAGRPGVSGYTMEALFIGATSWPWAARAVRAQTFSLVARDFVDMARLTGRRGWKIVVWEIAPNMSSYLLMMFILLFGGAILIGATLDFIGLGPANAMSLGLMMNNAVTWSALLLGNWWWFIPPGIGIMGIVGGLYVMNVGLDEVFNPRLRAL